MASNIPAAEDEGADGGQHHKRQFDSIVVKKGKIKYMDPNFHKVHAKMYDHKCDIKLKVGNDHFKAHRDVLAEASDYFAAMFSHDMKEREQDVIEIKGISAVGVSVILGYFYHGHVCIDQYNIEDVLEVARFFHVEFLLDVCCNYLVRELGMENYQNVLILADKYWLGDLRGDIFGFFGLNIMKLSEEQNFFENLDADLLIQFLKEDIFVDAPEDFMLFLVRKWVKTKPEERKDLLLPLLRLIRFPLFDWETLENLPTPIIQFPEIQDAVQEAIHYNTNIFSQCLRQEKRFLARGAHPNVILFMGSNAVDGHLRMVYRSLIFPDDHPFTYMEDILSYEMSDNFHYSSVVTVGDFLYCIGGYDDQVCSSNRVFRFSIRTREWLELAPMQQPRVSHGACASHDRIFAVGGVDHQIQGVRDEEHILASVEMYDVCENTWVPLPDLVHGSYDHAAAYCNNILYATGGISAEPLESIPTNSAYRLNLDSEVWEPMQGMLYGRQGHSMTALHNRLFVIGGYAANHQGVPGFRDCMHNEMYDIEMDQWTEIASTPPKYGHIMRSVAVFQDKIFVIGEVQLVYYHTQEDRFQDLERYGAVVQKLVIMNATYPFTLPEI